MKIMLLCPFSLPFFSRDAIFLFTVNPGNMYQLHDTSPYLTGAAFGLLNFHAHNYVGCNAWWKGMSRNFARLAGLSATSLCTYPNIVWWAALDNFCEERELLPSNIPSHSTVVATQVAMYLHLTFGWGINKSRFLFFTQEIKSIAARFTSSKDVGGVRGCTPRVTVQSIYNVLQI